eukprot:6207431-Ditylum_brightwellii.AAC.1
MPVVKPSPSLLVHFQEDGQQQQHVQSHSYYNKHDMGNGGTPTSIYSSSSSNYNPPHVYLAKMTTFHKLQKKGMLALVDCHLRHSLFCYV